MDQNLRDLLGGEPIKQYASEDINPGVICTTVIPYIPNRFHAVEPLSSNTASPDSRKYQLLSMDYRSLISYLNSTERPPHFEMGVRSDESVLTYKVKIRPVVVLTRHLSGEGEGFPRHFKGCVLCAPLYTLVEKDNIIKSSYNPTAVAGIVALKYRSAFPLPTHPHLDSQMSFLRLDQIQPVRVNYLSTPIAKVTSKWLGFIRAWIYFYGTGKLRHKLLQEARPILLEAAEQQKQL